MEVTVMLLMDSKCNDKKKRECIVLHSGVGLKGTEVKTHQKSIFLIHRYN